MARKVKKKRNVIQKNEYSINRGKHRKTSNRHVLVLETDMSEDEKRHVFHLSENIRKASNQVVNTMNKRLDQMERTKAYRETKIAYNAVLNKIKNISDEDSKQFKALTAEKKNLSKMLQEIQISFGITKKDVEEVMRKVGDYMGIHSVFCLSRSIDIWQGIEEVLYGNGTKLNRRKYQDYPEICATQPERAIIVQVKDGKLKFLLDVSKKARNNAKKIGAATTKENNEKNKRNVIKFGVKIKKNDQFAQMEVDNIINFQTNPDAEKLFVQKFIDTEIPQDTFRVCYAALNCKIIRGKLRVYVHLTIEGKPVLKFTKDGNLRHPAGKGRVGVDIGTQSIAYVSDTEIGLDNLAERNGKSTKASEAKEKAILRYMDRSRRATNPDRYNADGTYKKGTRGEMKKSKRYLKATTHLKDIRRKNAVNRHLAINEMANHLRTLGDVLITEQSNAKALAKKAKPKVVINEKTGKKKNRRRKRFGRSIQNRCPGYMHEALKKKFTNYNTVDMYFRASQYNHVSDSYEKKKLSQRWHELCNEIKIQRDIYSGFLLYCALADFKSPDRNLCIKKFDEFYKKHQQLIADIIKNGQNICNSGIKIPKTA